METTFTVDDKPVEPTLRQRFGIWLIHLGSHILKGSPPSRVEMHSYTPPKSPPKETGMSKISKTTFTFTVLHRTDEPFTWDESDGDSALDNNLGEALSRSWDGHAVGWVTSEITEDVADEDVPDALVELGNDGEFFDLDLEGQESY